jgi:hypothetical protein
MLFSNIRFHNFGADMTPLMSCNMCHTIKLWVTGGKATFFQNIQYTNVTGNYIFWEKWRREIFHDLDGSLTRPIQQAMGVTYPSATVMPFMVHNQIPGKCVNESTSKWDESLICNENATVRKLMLTNPVPLTEFSLLPMKVTRFSGTLSATPADYTEIITYKIKKSNDKHFSWAAPFVTGQVYNLHWAEGINFEHMAAVASDYLSPQEPATILRFNYTGNRELWEINELIRGLKQPFVAASTALDASTCTLGQYTHDVDSKVLQVCVSGRGKAATSYLDINGVICRYLCPTNALIGGPKENFIRMWSNASQWPNGALPALGDSVVVPGPWNVVMDLDPPALKYLEVQGNLIFDANRDNLLQAYNIWVRGGVIQAGAKGSPFTKKAQIVLLGSQAS